MNHIQKSNMLVLHMQVVSEQSMVTDILLMKQANFNAVRMSHYPNTQRFYQLCTALGLYAIDEANLETHGFDAALCKNYLNPANSQLWTPCMLDRAVRMFEQNKNHGFVAIQIPSLRVLITHAYSAVAYPALSFVIQVLATLIERVRGLQAVAVPLLS